MRKLTGNSVAVPVFKAVAEEIVKAINNQIIQPTFKQLSLLELEYEYS